MHVPTFFLKSSISHYLPEIVQTQLHPFLSSGQILQSQIVDSRPTRVAEENECGSAIVNPVNRTLLTNERDQNIKNGCWHFVNLIKYEEASLAGLHRAFDCFYQALLNIQIVQGKWFDSIPNSAEAMKAELERMFYLVFMQLVWIQKEMPWTDEGYDMRALETAIKEMLRHQM